MSRLIEIGRWQLFLAYDRHDKKGCHTEYENIQYNCPRFSYLYYNNDGLCRQGKFSEATDCFKKSLENGLCIDLCCLMNRLDKDFIQCFIYDSTVQAFCRHGYCSSADIFILCLILDKMLAK
ncbi:hypothetical protein ACMD2_20165, partial [Ananas comosus]